MPGRHDRDPLDGRRCSLCDELVLRRLRERDDRRAPVDERRDAELERATERAPDAAAASSPTSSRARGAATRPCGRRGPQRREERHAVPDLDESVARAVPAHHLAERGAREHEVAAGLADHPVAVAPASPAGDPAAYEVRIVTSMPASAHSDATRDACSSEPPASGSSRSRQARIAIRRRPGGGGEVAELADDVGSVETRADRASRAVRDRVRWRGVSTRCDGRTVPDYAARSVSRAGRRAIRSPALGSSVVDRSCGEPWRTR